MNILLVGEYYSSNLGDGIICETVQNMLTQEFGNDINIHLFDISGKVTWGNGTTTSNYTNNKSDYQNSQPKYIYLVKKAVKKRFGKSIEELSRIRHLLKNLKKYEDNIDVIIFAGGQMFMDYFALPIFLIVKKFSKRNIPISFNACGVGRLENNLKKYLLKSALTDKSVKYITVRDNLETFKSKYVGKSNLKVKRVYDPAILVDKYFSIPEDKSEMIGLGVMHPNICRNNGIDISDDGLIQLWGEIVNILDKKELNWQFFTNGSVADYKFAITLCDKLNYNPNTKIAKRPTTPIGLLKLIGKYKSIISFRLHSHIIAYSYRIPSIGFVWDKKVMEFAKSIKREKYFFDFNNLDICYQLSEILSNDQEFMNLKKNDEIDEETKADVLNSLLIHRK